jgi:hypothetical protein
MLTKLSYEVFYFIIESYCWFELVIDNTQNFFKKNILAIWTKLKLLEILVIWPRLNNLSLIHFDSLWAI